MEAEILKCFKSLINNRVSRAFSSVGKIIPIYQSFGSGVLVRWFHIQNASIMSSCHWCHLLSKQESLCARSLHFCVTWIYPRDKRSCSRDWTSCVNMDVSLVDSMLGSSFSMQHWMVVDEWEVWWARVMMYGDLVVKVLLTIISATMR